jgi:response regulator RpfG family c-di-GMP phosphodiesterase
MTTPLLISLIAFAWLLTAVVVAFPVARFLSLGEAPAAPRPPQAEADPRVASPVASPAPPAPDLPANKRVLIVDDDEGLRLLLRTTLEAVHLRVDEADGAATAAGRIAAERPDVVVLDVGMPGMDGVTFCRRLKADPATKHIAVVLLTGADEGTEAAAEQAGADGFLRKPFSPLTLLRLIERVSEESVTRLQMEPASAEHETGQLMLYARDLRHLLDLERGQRLLLQNAYRETANAFSRALESKDTGTGVHSQRVQHYATELIAAVDPELAANPSVEYGFLLHDVGKIGIPDRILRKPDRLTPAERGVLETHSALGHQMLADVVLLRSKGLEVVRSHHERWDGHGYPDHLRSDAIPLAARVFAVADTLDAMTTDRPYRRGGRWADASAEIVSQAGRQFDPDVVQAFCDLEPRLREIHREFAEGRKLAAVV